VQDAPGANQLGRGTLTGASAFSVPSKGNGKHVRGEACIVRRRKERAAPDAAVRMLCRWLAVVSCQSHASPHFFVDFERSWQAGLTQQIDQPFPLRLRSQELLKHISSNPEAQKTNQQSEHSPASQRAQPLYAARDGAAVADLGRIHAAIVDMAECRPPLWLTAATVVTGASADADSCCCSKQTTKLAVLPSAGSAVHAPLLRLTQSMIASRSGARSKRMAGLAVR
jgi:hypothetical protein